MVVDARIAATFPVKLSAKSSAVCDLVDALVGSSRALSFNHNALESGQLLIAVDQQPMCSLVHMTLNIRLNSPEPVWLNVKLGIPFPTVQPLPVDRWN